MLCASAALCKIRKKLPQFVRCLRFSTAPTEQNPQWSSIVKFLAEDKHLNDLKLAKYVHDFRLDETCKSQGVFLLFGGRQIGKTTALKQLLAKFLLNGTFKPEQTLYLNCDFLLDREDLEKSLRDFFQVIDRNQDNLVIIDEVSNLSDWQLTIKGIIDLGWTKNSIILLTASDKILLEDSAKGFPGIHRRGVAATDIALYPICFHEYLKLITPNLNYEDPANYAEIFRNFMAYLETGGYLSAINTQAGKSANLNAVYQVYQNWLISDFLRKNKNKSKLIDLLRVILERYGSQISFSKIANESMGLSTETVISYVDHLKDLEY